MNEILDLLDNREKAFLIWAAIGVALALGIKNVRPALLSVLGILLDRKILIVLALGAAWVSLEVLLLRWWLWDLGMVKQIAIWVFGQAVIMVFSIHKALSDAAYFKKTVLATLKATIALDFLVNFYVFPLAAEVVLAPILLFLAAMLAVSETGEEYMPAKRLMQFVMVALGLSLLGYAVARLMGDVESFVSMDTLRRLVLPIALTLLFLPFVYALAVYSAYEVLFVRMGFLVGDAELARYTKHQVLRACHFRLSRVNRFASQYATRLNAMRSQRDTAKLISEFAGR
jgi:hypothetical protein